MEVVEGRGAGGAGSEGGGGGSVERVVLATKCPAPHSPLRLSEPLLLPPPL